MIVCDICHKEIDEKDVEKVVEYKGKQTMKADLYPKCYAEFVNFVSKNFNSVVYKLR